MPPRLNPTYRYPGEQIILFLTCLGVLLFVFLTATLTIHLLLVIVLIGVVTTYFLNRTRHQSLLRSAMPVTSQTAPALAQISMECARRLQPGPIELFIAKDSSLNAYTFGLSDPKVIVLYSALFAEMDADEIRFILGHEMGHVCLGHTWLNSLVGGMAGVPSTFLVSTLFKAAFLWWNRACEYSADRAGLLACANPARAISALIKLETGPGKIQSSADVQRVLQLIQKEDGEAITRLSELFATHPTIVHRIKALSQYASSPGYARWKKSISQAG